MHSGTTAGLMLTLILVLTGMVSCTPTEPPAAQDTIKIAYLPITHALPALLERELAGQDPDAPHVELVRYGSWPELMDALNTGRVDGASVLGVLAVKAREQGIGLKMAALGHRDGNVIVVTQDIQTTADLKGKTLAVPHRQSSHNLLIRQLLAEAGLSDKDVRIVELAPAEMPPALSQGTIAAYCVAEPFGARAVALGVGKVLRHADALWPHSLCCALVFNEKFLTAHRERARRYVAAYLRAGASIAARPIMVNGICERQLKMDAEVRQLSLQWISFTDLPIHPEEYAALTARMQQWGLSNSPPSYADMVDPTLARERR